MRKEEKRILGLTASAHTLAHIFELAIPPLFPLLAAAFGVTYFKLGLLITIFSYAFGLGALPAGILADRIGPRRLMSVYLLGAGGAALLVLGANRLIVFGVLVTFMGLFCSVYHPSATTLIARTMSKKGKAFGIQGIAGSLGTALAPLFAAGVAEALGWKAPFAIVGAASILIGIFSLTFPAYRTTETAANGEGEKAADEPKTSKHLIVIFFSAAALLGLGYKGIMTFLPLYMGENITADILGMDKVVLGGSITTIALLAGIFGQYLGGHLSDRFRPERLYLTAVLIGTVMIIVMTYSRNISLVISAMIFAFFYFSVQPVQNIILSRLFKSKHHGMGYGIFFFTTFGIGSTSAAVAGYLTDHYSLRAAFQMLSACFAGSAVLLIIFLILYRKEKPAR